MSQDVIERLAARTFGDRRRIVLMRHGSVNYFDAEGNPVGSDMVPLNELGRGQAKAAGDLLKDLRFDRVIVSGLPRTIETAELVLQHNRHGAPPYETWAELREIRAARMQDLADADVEAGFLRSFAAPADLGLRFLGGEILGDFVDRVRPAFQRLVADASWRQSLLVLHGGTNRALLSHCLSGGERTFFGTLHQTPACVNLIDVGDAPGDFVVRAMNIAPPDLLQAKSRKTTLEELLEHFLKYRRRRQGV